MRCPKCGYISFDQQNSCGKCGNNLTAVVERIRGTVSKAATPSFLGGALAERDEPGANFRATHAEPEETLVLDDIEAEPGTINRVATGLAEGLPDDDRDDSPDLPALDLDSIYVSDLMPQEENEDEAALPLSDLQEEEPKAEEGIALLGEIEFPGLEPEDEMIIDLEEHEDLSGIQEKKTAGPNTDEPEEIIDLAALMDAEAPSPKAGSAPEDQAAAIPDLGLSLEKDAH